MKVHAKVVGEYELDGCCAQSGLNVLRKVLVRKGMKNDEELYLQMCIALPSHMDSQNGCKDDDVWEPGANKDEDGGFEGKAIQITFTWWLSPVGGHPSASEAKIRFGR